MTNTIDFSIYKPEFGDELHNAKRILGSRFEGLDLRYVDDQYGNWIDISENEWVGVTNIGEISHGVTFINGVLYELDASAYFYRDSEPYWSVVVHAPTEAVNKLYMAISGVSYPVFEADGTDDDAFKKLLDLKEAGGFIYKDDVFEQINKIPESIGSGLLI